MKPLLRIGVAMMLAMISFATYAYDFEVDKIFYSILSDTECGVSGGSKGTVEIPETVNGYTVTEILLAPDYVESIKLPSTIKKIHSDAFKNKSNLRNIEIPDGVEHIGWYAFAYCKNLTSIKLPESLKVLHAYCFVGCTSLSEIIFPEGLEEIQMQVFYLDKTNKSDMIPWLKNQPDGPIYINN